MKEAITFIIVGLAGITIGLCFGYVLGCAKSYKKKGVKNDSDKDLFKKC